MPEPGAGRAICPIDMFDLLEDQEKVELLLLAEAATSAVRQQPSESE